MRVIYFLLNYKVFKASLQKAEFITKERGKNMYTRITRNDIKRNYLLDINVFSFSYCEIDYIISALNMEATGYNAGVYGWNYTTYENNSGHRLLIVIGYRPIKAIRINSNISERYNKKVRELIYNQEYKRATATAKRFIKILEKEIIQRLNK